MNMDNVQGTGAVPQIGKDNAYRGDAPREAESAGGNYGGSGKIVVMGGIGTIFQEKNSDGYKTPKQGVAEHVVGTAVSSIVEERSVSLDAEGVKVVIEGLMVKDSTDVTSEDHEKIAKAVYSVLLDNEVMGVVLPFGTSTMKEFMPRLMVMLGSDKPVHVTCADKAYNERNTDAFRNIKKSIIGVYEFARRGMGGVFLNYDRRIVEGTWVHEREGRPHGAAEHTIADFNGDSIRIKNGNEKKYREFAARRRGSTLNVELDKNVSLFNPTAGMDLERLAKKLKMLARESNAVILEGTHDLSVRSDLHPAIKSIARNMPMIVTSETFVVPDQGSYGVTRDLHEAGVIFGTGSKYLDKAMLEAAVGGGNTINNIKERFLDYKTRAFAGIFDSPVTPDDLERALGIAYREAETMAWGINRRYEEGGAGHTTYAFRGTAVPKGAGKRKSRQRT